MNAAGRFEVIEELCSFEGRGPGTDAERRAANLLANRLKEMGRRAEVEPTYVHPEWSLAIALHIAVAIGGSLLALLFPPAGFALVLLAACPQAQAPAPTPTVRWGLNHITMLNHPAVLAWIEAALAEGSQPGSG